MVLQLALVADDIRAYDFLRKHVYLIKPPLWDGIVNLHILVKNPKDNDPDAMVLRLAAVQLGLVDPVVARLHDHEQVRLGWDET